MSNVIDQAPASTTRNKGRLRLEYLDGIRAVLSIYVVLYHCVIFPVLAFPGAIYPRWWHYASRLLDCGHYAVDMFIVLSGYVLMMPAVTSYGNRLSGGVSGYLKRRAWRILPTYYTSIIFSLLVIAMLPGLSRAHNVHWTDWLPAFAPLPILSHILLIQNVRPDWTGEINSPTWTIATEWQIYFMLPLLILIWQRTNVSVMVAVAVAIGITISKVFPSTVEGCPWYLGLFAMGGASAIVCFSTQKEFVKARNWAGWTVLTSVLAFAGFLSIIGVRIHVLDFQTLRDSVAGVTGASFLIYLYRRFEAESSAGATVKNAILRFLLSRPAQLIGSFSYSIYAFHGPIVNTFQYFFTRAGMPPFTQIAMLIIVAFPSSILISYCFYLAVERRCISPKSLDHLKARELSGVR